MKAFVYYIRDGYFTVQSLSNPIDAVYECRQPYSVQDGGKKDPLPVFPL